MSAKFQKYSKSPNGKVYISHPSGLWYGEAPATPYYMLDYSPFLFQRRAYFFDCDRNSKKEFIEDFANSPYFKSLVSKFPSLNQNTIKCMILREACAITFKCPPLPHPQIVPSEESEKYFAELSALGFVGFYKGGKKYVFAEHFRPALMPAAYTYYQQQTTNQPIAPPECCAW